MNSRYVPTISNTFSLWRFMSRKPSGPAHQESDLKASQRQNLEFNTAEIQKENLGLKIPLLICYILDYGISTFHQIEKGNWEAHRIKFQMLYVIINIRVTPATRSPTTYCSIFKYSKSIKMGAAYISLPEVKILGVSKCLKYTGWDCT